MQISNLKFCQFKIWSFLEFEKSWMEKWIKKFDTNFPFILRGLVLTYGVSCAWRRESKTWKCHRNISNCSKVFWESKIHTSEILFHHMQIVLSFSETSDGSKHRLFHYVPFTKEGSYSYYLYGTLDDKKTQAPPYANTNWDRYTHALWRFLWDWDDWGFLMIFLRISLFHQQILYLIYL